MTPASALVVVPPPNGLQTTGPEAEGEGDGEAECEGEALGDGEGLGEAE